jgi:hypothetical protein
VAGAERLAPQKLVRAAAFFCSTQIFIFKTKKKWGFSFFEVG